MIRRPSAEIMFLLLLVLAAPAVQFSVHLVSYGTPPFKHLVSAVGNSDDFRIRHQSFDLYLFCYLIRFFLKSLIQRCASRSRFSAIPLLIVVDDFGPD